MAMYSDNMFCYFVGSGRYTSSQYLADSSLSEEINVFDYAGGIGQFSGSFPTEHEGT